MASIGMLAACARGPAAAGAPVDSGVAGQAVVDAGCPVLRPDSPCPQHPVRARITVTRPGSTEVAASAETDAQGQFRIPLAAGTYLLHPANITNAVLPRAGVVQVTVEAGSYRQVRIQFDSGVRSPIPGG